MLKNINDKFHNFYAKIRNRDFPRNQINCLKCARISWRGRNFQRLLKFKSSGKLKIVANDLFLLRLKGIYQFIPPSWELNTKHSSWQILSQIFIFQILQMIAIYLKQKVSLENIMQGLLREQWVGVNVWIG